MKKFITSAATAALSAMMLFTSVACSYANNTAVQAMPVNTAVQLEYSAQFPQTIETATSTTLRMMEEMSIPGVTIALVDAETGFSWTQGFGYADSGNGLRVDEHTLFQIGSASKLFTAVAIMQLVEQGIIDLDKPIVTYLPEFSILPSFRFGGNPDNITARMLLTNTSGVVSDNFGGGFMTVGNEHYRGAMNDALDWIVTQEMTFEEGTQFDYANTGWVLLGIIAARMTGHSDYFDGFVQYTDEFIFELLGMDRSTYQFLGSLTNVAMPYLETGTPEEMFLTNALSAGSVLSSAHDMARFMQTMLSDGTLDGQRLLTQETIMYMLQNHTTHVEMAPGFEGYGLGAIHMNVNGLETVGHGGNSLFYHTELIFNLENGLGVFVSTNSATGAAAASPIAHEIMAAALMEKTGSVPRVEAEDVPLGLAGLEPVTLSGDALENFIQWAGIYTVVRHVENDMPPLLEIAIAVDETDMPMITLVQTFGAMAVPLTLIDGRWFLGRWPVLFAEEDGVATIDILGGRFVRQ